MFVNSLVCLFALQLSLPIQDGGQAKDEQVSTFAEDVLLHVVLHELGHALIREFDLPILGNEETMADAFATWYMTHHLPERAFNVLKARTDSLMIEAQEDSSRRMDGKRRTQQRCSSSFSDCGSRSRR